MIAEDCVVAEAAAAPRSERRARSRRFWIVCIVVLGIGSLVPWVWFVQHWLSWGSWYGETPWSNELRRVDLLYTGFLALLAGVVVTVAVLLLPRSRTPLETRSLRLAVRVAAALTFTSWALALALTSPITGDLA